MIRYLPSIKGWLAVALALFAFFFIPEIFPARIHGDGRPSPPVPIGIWIVGAMILVCCAIAALSVVICSRVPDKVVGVLAGLVTLWMIVMYIRAFLT
jgi:hypothetical protein